MRKLEIREDGKMYWEGTDYRVLTVCRDLIYANTSLLDNVYGVSIEDKYPELSRAEISEGMKTYLGVGNSQGLIPTTFDRPFYEIPFYGCITCNAAVHALLICLVILVPFWLLIL